MQRKLEQPKCPASKSGMQRRNVYDLIIPVPDLLALLALAVVADVCALRG